MCVYKTQLFTYHDGVGRQDPALYLIYNSIGRTGNMGENLPRPSSRHTNQNCLLGVSQQDPTFKFNWQNPSGVRAGVFGQESSTPQNLDQPR